MGEQQQPLHNMLLSQIIDIIESDNSGRFSKIDTDNDGLHIFYDGENECSTVIHYNPNRIEDLFDTLVYLLTDYQPASKRLLEMETVAELEKIYDKNRNIYGVGIGYGAVTMLQTLPYCRRDYFKNTPLKYFDSPEDNWLSSISKYPVLKEAITTFVKTRKSYPQLFLETIAEGGDFSDDLKIILGERYSTLINLEQTVFATMIHPLTLLKEQKYDEMKKTFIDKVDIHSVITNAIDILKQGECDKEFINLAELLLETLKVVHGRNLSVSVKKGLSVHVTIQPIYS